MFCKNCGANLPDDAKFCTTCGAVTGEAPVSAAQPQVIYVQKASNPMVEKFVSTIKNFFSKPVAAVSASAKSVTHEWSILAAINIVLYALGAAVVGLEMISQLLGSMIGSLAKGMDLGEIYPFFAIFGIGLLIGVATYFATSLGIWILIAKIFKKNASFTSVLNMVATASLPLGIISLANMLLGLIYAPITIIFFIVAFAMSVILLYNGSQKFEKLDKSPFYGFGIVLLIVVAIAFLLGLLYFSAIGDSISEFATSSVGNLLGGLGNLGSSMSNYYDMF